MADEKSVVKMNEMIHKETGASFLVVYVIYVKLQLHTRFIGYDSFQTR